MNRSLKIALLITAIDRASGVVEKIFGKSTAALEKFRNAALKLRDGSALLGIGESIVGSLKPAIDAFAEMEEAGNRLKSVMLNDKGLLNQQLYDRLFNQAQEYSGLYAGTAASYLEMQRVLKQNRIDERDILGGVGEGVAQLADYFQMMPAPVAEFAAHLKNDMGVLPEQMTEMMDLAARLHDAGVGKTGGEAVNQLNEFFGKAGLGMSNIGATGLKESKSMGAMGALFMSRGLSGQTVGNNIRRILDGVRDAEKISKANEVAANYGKHLDFFDKKGQFLGIDNFVKQIAKLEDLNPQKIAAILKPFSGRQGLSTDFLEYLAQHGLEGLNEFLHHIDRQATLTQKLKVQMDGVNYQQTVLSRMWKTIKANFGASMKPALDAFNSLMEKAYKALNGFILTHPRLSKFISAFVAFTGAAFMLGGVIKIIQGVGLAIKALTLVMATNPILLAIGAIITAAALIYTYWDEIVPYFKALWSLVKVIFNASWNWIKRMFLNYTPLGLVIKHWKTIKGFFSNLWGAVKVIFRAAWEWIKEMFLNYTPYGLVIKHWEPIKDFFSNLWESVKVKFLSFINWFADKWERLKNKVINPIGNLFGGDGVFNPNNPITKVDLYPAPFPGAERTVTLSGNKTTNTNNHNPQFHITVNGGATPADAQMIVSVIQKHFPRIYARHQHNMDRIGHS